MKDNIKNAIEEYQCSGCVAGSDISCFEKNDYGVGCGKHIAGTTILGIGKIFLGMPIGFNRLGSVDDLDIIMYETFDDISKEWGAYDKFNIAVWKYKNEDNHTFVRGLSPRTNSPFLHLFLEDCLNKIDCFEITENDIKGMD